MRLLWRVVRYVFSSVWLALMVVVGVPVVVAATVLAGLIFLPLPATIPIPRANLPVVPTTLYDQTGRLIATLHQYDSNIPVAEAQIPPVLKEAVVADEDRHFYQERGVDLRSIARAALADLRSGRTVQGGSTITQQYVKLAYTNGLRNVQRKIREAILASQLDRVASKNEILYRYLSAVYFGDGNHGIGAAAENYFHVPVQQLDASQSAALAGLIPAPSARALRDHLAHAEQFRILVLAKMHAQGYLSDAAYLSAVAEKLAPASEAHPPANATLVYPVATSASQYPDFVDYVTRWLLAHYPPSVVYGGGLKVQTTLSPAIEADAVKAVGSTLSGTSDPLEMALAAVQPQTGFVEAIVGGRAFGQPGAPYQNDNFAISGCDFSTAGLTSPALAGQLARARAVQASSTVKAGCWDGNDINAAGGDGRQPGSSWKPFVLATAFEQGIPPTATYRGPGIYDIPGCRVATGQPPDSCQVHNDETSESGTFTLSSAMAASVNTVYAQVAPQVGCANVAQTAKALGVASAYWSPTEFPYCERYALGELDVSPLDMASAYGVFDDHGQRAEPTPVLEVLDGSGKVLVDNITKAPPVAAVMAANVADNVTKVLQGVLTPGGTAGAHPLGRPAAGKTGTSSNETNAWFTGYAPTLSASVWMGYADRASRPLGSIKGVYPVVGGTWPAATWQAFMTMALASVPATPFNAPAPIVPPRPTISAGPATTVPPLQPGSSGVVVGSPSGGPYVQPAAAPLAPAPVTTTTIPATTTTSTTAVPTTLSPPGPTIGARPNLTPAPTTPPGSG